MKKTVIFLLALLLVLAACSPPNPAISNTPETIGLGTPPPTLQPGTVLRTAEPSTWQKYSLTGHLHLIEFNPDGNRLFSLDLATGLMTLLYQAPQRSLLTGATISPDGKQLVLVYAPPPTSDGSFTFSTLYLMPSDGSSLPKLLIPGANPDDAYYNPSWSPDGKSIYSSHLHAGDAQQGTPDQYTIEQVSLDGQTSTVFSNAIWPVLSPDGTKIAYLTVENNNTVNNLYIANLDGSNPQPVIPVGTFLSVDAHLFTHDGKAVIFSAVNPTTQTSPSLTWLDKLFGVTVASAHNVPSDWYEQPLAGGSPVRLTHVADMGMNAALSPDGKDMAFIGSQGLYNLDLGSSQTQQLSTLEVVGTVSWAP